MTWLSRRKELDGNIEANYNCYEGNREVLKLLRGESRSSNTVMMRIEKFWNYLDDVNREVQMDTRNVLLWMWKCASAWFLFLDFVFRWWLSTWGEVKGYICKCQVTVQCYLILFISRLLEPVTFYTIHTQLSYSRSTTFCSYAAAAAAAPARPTQPSCNPWRLWAQHNMQGDTQSRWLMPFSTSLVGWTVIQNGFGMKFAKWNWHLLVKEERNC